MKMARSVSRNVRLVICSLLFGHSAFISHHEIHINIQNKGHAMFTELGRQKRKLLLSDVLRHTEIRSRAVVIVKSKPSSV